MCYERNQRFDNKIERFRYKEKKANELWNFYWEKKKVNLQKGRHKPFIATLIEPEWFRRRNHCFSELIDCTLPSRWIYMCNEAQYITERKRINTVILFIFSAADNACHEIRNPALQTIRVTEAKHKHC